MRLEADSLEHRPRRIVTEYHSVELDFAARASQALGSRAISDLGIDLQQLEASPEARLGPLDLPEGLRDLVDRLVQRSEVSDEYDEIANSQFPAHRMPSAKINHERSSNRDHNVNRARVDRLQRVELKRLAEARAARLHELAIRLALAGERLHDVDGRQRAVCDGIKAALLDARPAGETIDPAAD